MRARPGPLPNRVDGLLATVLFVGASVYIVTCWPRTLIPLDEGAYLYEAKRVVGGDVMYRDFFELVGPASVYAMALVFALFGASMEAARLSMALVHGGIAALMYAAVRQMGVRPLLAAAVGLAHVALLFPSMSFASPHWLSTFLTLIAFCMVLRGPLTGRRAALAVGAVIGAVALTQQSKGVPMAVAVAVVLLRDAWSERGARGWWRALIEQGAAFGAGLLLVVGPSLGAFISVAGFARVYEALVYTPLIAYRQFAFHREGTWLLLSADAGVLRLLLAELSPMLILNVLPLIIPFSALRLVWQAAHGVPAAARRPLFVAVVFSCFAMTSVFYQPNYFHFAIVGAIWMSLWGDLLESVARRLERGRWRALAPAVALCVIALLGLEMRRSLTRAWRSVAEADTPFGSVHFQSQALADEAVALRETIQRAGATAMLVYPSQPGMYLLSDTVNPTRFQLLIPGYTTDAQFAEVRDVLERERVPFVLKTFWFWGEHPDPLRDYLREHYERVRLPRKGAGLPSLLLLRRKPETDRG